MDIFEKLRQKKMELAASETQATDNQTAFQAAKPPVPPTVPKLTLPGVSTIKAPPERVPEPVKMNMGNLDAVPESFDLSEEDQDAMLASLDMTMDLGDDDDDDDDGDDDYEVAEQDGIVPPAPEPVRPQVTGLNLKPLSLAPARAAGIGHPGPTPEPTLAPARVADIQASVPVPEPAAEPGLAPLEPVPEPAPEHEPPAKPRVLGLSLPVKAQAAPETKTGLSLPAGSMLARMQARGQEQKAAETAGLEAFNVGGLSAPRPGLSPAGAIAAAAAAPRSYSPEEYRDDWEALPELIEDADGQAKDEYNRERMLLIARASNRIQEIFGGELQGLAVTAASEMSIAEVSQLVKLTFIRVKAAPGAWAMLDLQDKAKIIAGMKAMAVKRNSSVKSRKPKDASALSSSLETMGSSLSDEDMAELDNSGFTMAFGEWPL